MLGPVSTEIGDRIWVQLSVPDMYYRYVTNQPPKGKAGMAHSIGG